MTEVDAEWEMTFAELRTVQSRHESNDRVRESLGRLMNVEVVVHYTDKESEESRTLKTRLLEFTDTSDGNKGSGTVQYGVPKRLRVILADSNRWGRVRSEVVYAMTSKYAIALYEFIQLRRNLGKSIEVLTLERFRALLGVPPGAYERHDNFRAKVLEPALLEVNGVSDMGVDIELRREHSRAPVQGVAVSWWKKEGDEFRAAMAERNRPKVGRKARLRGTVENTEV